MTEDFDDTNYDFYDDEVWDDEDQFEDDMIFQDANGKSALRAAALSNPKNLPCPDCKRENMLTQKDVDQNYVCDMCADIAEGLV